MPDDFSPGAGPGVTAPGWLLDFDGDVWVLDAEPTDAGDPVYYTPTLDESVRTFLTPEEVQTQFGVRERGAVVRIEPVLVTAGGLSP